MARPGRKRKQGVKREKVFDGEVLPEDRYRDTTGTGTVFRIKKLPVDKMCGVVEKTETDFAPVRDIEDRLITAMKTIRSMPDKDYRFLKLKGASIPYVHEYMDAYNSSDIRPPKFVPTPAEISDCLVALSWVRHVSKNNWKIMWLRSFGLSFGVIGKYIGRSDETARIRYKEGITDAWAAANGIG